MEGWGLETIFGGLTPFLGGANGHIGGVPLLVIKVFPTQRFWEGSQGLENFWLRKGIGGQKGWVF